MDNAITHNHTTLYDIHISYLEMCTTHMIHMQIQPQ